MSLSRYRLYELSCSQIIAQLELCELPVQKFFRKFLKNTGNGKKPFSPTRNDTEHLKRMIEYDFITFDDSIGVYRLSERCIAAAAGVNTYLRRKFDNETNHFDRKMPPKYPAGAQISAAIDRQTGEFVTVLAFPNDFITDLLDFYHCNRLSDLPLLVKDATGAYNYANEADFKQ